MEEEKRKVYRIDIYDFRKKFPKIEGKILSVIKTDFVGERRFEHIEIETVL